MPKEIKKSLALAVLCLLVPDAQAESQYPDIWITSGFYSYHFDRDIKRREDNTGWGVEAAFSDRHAVLGGTFINSEFERTYYAGYLWRPLRTDLAGVNIAAGLALLALDGYPRVNNGGWFPVVLPGVSVEYKRVGLNFTVIPTIQNHVDGAVAVQFKLRLW